MSNGRLAELLKLLDTYGAGEQDTPKARTRARILDAAARLFERHGYRRTSIDEVARAAGIAKGTVYVHFASKVELLVHTIAEEKKRYLARIVPVLTSEASPAERLRDYLTLAFALAPEMPLVSRLSGGDRELLVFLEDLGPELRSQMDAQQTALVRALLEGVGEYDRLDEATQVERARALLALMYSSLQLMDERVRAGLSRERLAKALAAIIVEGIGAP